MTTKRPNIVSNEHLTFLDELRESGITNMFGAGPHLEFNFALTKAEARVILTYWMQSFGDANR
jgi:hypothetical protein